MPLTAEQGYKIREENSTTKEKNVCDAHGLEQIGGSRGKIDGTNGVKNKSIKNASGNSTQVHLTTQKHFMKQLGISGDASKFIGHFCGNKDYNYNGSDRRFIKEIDPQYTEAFREFLNTNKLQVVDLIVRNGFDITSVVYNYREGVFEGELTYQEIIDKLDDTEWVFAKGGIHLKLHGEIGKNGKRKRGKTIFHFQRESKQNPKQRYNVLWHIHMNLFK
tara:strand:- start:7141 stop:7797 length:657 start_codon:yes stop_codon:yes gene_type:complete